ncbi:hypothetical protein F0562_033437 [Nyssa sinensis]|uniref:Anaphase-promoting complex subunit 4 WD40 domain-containing protein n=1 Tax=Nyssa sinensis TaxID=561372 RepID=A0A5J5ADJ2_9ASTE|nr:hypothetical protein F0562_033437 [Nyssa sinensis]
MAQLLETYACVPSTERGRGILISGDPKSNSILYCNGRSVVIRYLDRPLEVSVYSDHSYPVTVARYSPNGEWIASADVSGTVRIWGTHNDYVLKNEFKVLSGRIDDLQWSPDNMRIVASGDGKGKSFVRAFMWDSGQYCRGILMVTQGGGHSNFVNCLRFSPDGSKFITVSSDKKGIIYDGKSGERIGELAPEDGHVGSIYAVSWSPDSKQVVTVSADKSAKVWEILDDGNLDEIPLSLSGHMKNVTALTVLKSNQKMILSGSYDGIIIRWIQGIGYNGKLERKENAKIKCFAAADEEIVSSGFDNKVWRVPLQGNECGAAEHVDVGSQPKDLSLALNTPELALISTDSGVVLLHGLKILSTINLGFSVMASTIAPDGSEAIVGGQDGKLHIFSISGDTLTEEAVLEKHRGAISVKLQNMLFHSARINCLAWSPDSILVATGSLDTCVIIYEVGKPASSRTTIKGAHLGGVYGLAFTDERSVG